MELQSSQQLTIDLTATSCAMLTIALLCGWYNLDELNLCPVHIFCHVDHLKLLLTADNQSNIRLHTPC